MGKAKHKLDVVIPVEIQELVKSVSSQLEASIGHTPSSYTFESVVNISQKKGTLRYLIKRFGKKQLRNEKILEVGCGFGLFVAVCNKRGHDCYGVDPDRDSYQGLFQARRRLLEVNGIDRAKILSGVGEFLPFVDGSFNYVLSFNVLEHVDNIQRVLEESVRVLRKGGILYFRCPNYFSFYEGHFGIVWLPFLSYSKPLAKAWVKLWGKNPKFVDELQFVRVQQLIEYSKKLPVEIIQVTDPMPPWKERIKIFYSKRSRASKFLQSLWFLSSTLGLTHIIRKLNMHYSISLMLKKL